VKRCAVTPGTAHDEKVMSYASSDCHVQLPFSVVLDIAPHQCEHPGSAKPVVLEVKMVLNLPVAAHD
jgi:hypothetical protein